MQDVCLGQAIHRHKNQFYTKATATVSSQKPPHATAAQKKEKKCRDENPRAHFRAGEEYVKGPVHSHEPSHNGWGPARGWRKLQRIALFISLWSLGEPYTRLTGTVRFHIWGWHFSVTGAQHTRFLQLPDCCRYDQAAMSRFVCTTSRFEGAFLSRVKTNVSCRYREFRGCCFCTEYQENVRVHVVTHGIWFQELEDSDW